MLEANKSLLLTMESEVDKTYYFYLNKNFYAILPHLKIILQYSNCFYDQRTLGGHILYKNIENNAKEYNFRFSSENFNFILEEKFNNDYISWTKSKASMYSEFDGDDKSMQNDLLFHISYINENYIKSQDGIVYDENNINRRLHEYSNPKPKEVILGNGEMEDEDELAIMHHKDPNIIFNRYPQHVGHDKLHLPSDKAQIQTSKLNHQLPHILQTSRKFEMSDTNQESEQNFPPSKKIKTENEVGSKIVTATTSKFIPNSLFDKMLPRKFNRFF